MKKTVTVVLAALAAGVVFGASRIDVAPGDNLVAVLASQTGLSSESPVTVQLAAGTYTAENSGVADDAEWMFTLEEGVILKGAGADATILDGELTRRVLRLKPGSKVMDLTVANAHSQGSGTPLRGYALDIDGAGVENCVVTNGLAADKSGSSEQFVYLRNGGTIADAQVCGTTFKSAGWGSQGGVLYVSSGTVTNCQIFANKFRDVTRSALTLDGADALAVDCDVYGNTGNGNGFSRVAGSGGASILSGGGRLVRCRVTDNKCNSGSGYYTGGLCVAGGDALVDCCVITNNASGFDANQTTAVAGGVLIIGSATLRNTLVAGNRLTGVNTAKVTVSGGVVVTSKDAAVENCTIVGNTLDGACCEGAGLRLKNASSVVNCIVWQNGGTPAGGEWMLGNVSNETASITHTCTTPLVDGEGNTDRDPKLKAKKGYLIRSTSPCVNAGDPTGWTADDVDLLGNPRLRKGTTIDMGCYQAALQGFLLMVR